jgi:hypothetical protein
VFLYRSKDVSICSSVYMCQHNAYRADEFFLEIEQAWLWGSARSCQRSRHDVPLTRGMLLDLRPWYSERLRLHLEDGQVERGARRYLSIFPLRWL